MWTQCTASRSSLQFHLRWSPGGSDGEVEAGSPGCGATYWRVQEGWPHIPIYAGCIALASKQRISYRIASLVWQCLSGWAPSYLRELCHPLSSWAGRRTLRSSVHGNLVVPFARSATMQACSFSMVGPTTWNGLPIDLRHLPNGACSQFHTFSRLFFSA